jgi:hypothetical protein
LEENMSENWRQQMLKRTENSKPSGGKPAKRRRRKDWREEETHDWGQWRGRGRNEGCPN